MKPTSLILPITESRGFQKGHSELILSGLEIQVLQMCKSLVTVTAQRSETDSPGKGIPWTPGKWGLFS